MTRDLYIYIYIYIYIRCTYKHELLRTGSCKGAGSTEYMCNFIVSPWEKWKVWILWNEEQNNDKSCQWRVKKSPIRL